MTVQELRDQLDRLIAAGGGDWPILVYGSEWYEGANGFFSPTISIQDGEVLVQSDGP